MASDPTLTAVSRREQLRLEHEQAENAPKNQPQPPRQAPQQPPVQEPVFTAADLPDEASFDLHIAGRTYVIEYAYQGEQTRQLNVPIPQDLDDVIVQMLHAIERSGYRKVTKQSLIRAWLLVALEGKTGGVQTIVNEAISEVYPRFKADQ